ncbi:MAG: hypothetical protein PWQ41_1193 [Bacillota bacterium]|nr:hypothetical protein [Bacillota bacterium]MDK2925419.1 hypothetical protein [Bacillota bacterium]MDK2959983.1 hypothetical protein [Bacillota bacterium]
MTFFALGALVLSWLFFFLAGFAWGRRRGKIEGRRLGLKEAPLAWRQESLIAGRCVLCQTSSGGQGFSYLTKEV